MGSGVGDSKPRRRQMDVSVYHGEQRDERPGDLTKLHTKQLLKELRRMRAWESVAEHQDEHDRYWGSTPSELVFTKEDAAYIEQLKVELATREHVPNKQEAKALRQAKAQAKRDR